MAAVVYGSSSMVGPQAPIGLVALSGRIMGMDDTTYNSRMQEISGGLLDE